MTGRRIFGQYSEKRKTNLVILQCIHKKSRETFKKEELFKLDKFKQERKFPELNSKNTFKKLCFVEVFSEKEKSTGMSYL